MRIALALSVALTLAACSGEGSTPPRAELPRSVLGVVWGEDDSFVARLDPRSLEPLPGPRAALGRAGGPWALSPDGSQVVFGGYRSLIRIFDLERMRVHADISERGDFSAAAWPEPRRILLATGFNWEIGVDVVMVDPLARGVLVRRSLGGSLQRSVPTDDGLLLLLGPRAGGIGAARLAVFSADGDIRVLRLGGVPAGFEHDQLADGFVVDRYRTPGLAVDPSGDTAFVVDADDEVAEIDLRTLRVQYHELRRTTSLLGRLRSWLEPSAGAKGASDGSVRDAVWVGSGLIAVSGWDDHASFDAEGHQTQTTTAAGVALVDTQGWSKRMLAPDATAASLAGDLLLVYGSRWNSWAGRFEGVGLSGFELGGERRFRLFGAKPVASVEVVGQHGYVRFDDSYSCQGRIVDLGSGRVLEGRELDVLCDRSLLSAGD